jgi:Domain of unknown function (DUF4349)
MNTEIEFLKNLETDLEDAASRELIRVQRATLQGSIRRNTSRTWMKVVVAAAAFLVVAGGIGFIATGGVMVMSGADTGALPQQARRAVDRGFQGVGSAVNGEAAPGQDVPEPATGPADLGYGEAPVPAAGVPGVNEQADSDAFDAAGRPPEASGQLRDLSKIVRDGRIGIVVRDNEFGDAVGDLTVIAERSGGFVLSSSTNNERSGTFVLRIPERSFDRARNAIRNLGVRVRFEDVRGDDVTAEFIDFTARLRILQTRKTLLNSLLVDADTTEEILRLSGQVEDVQLRIEQMQGQLRFLNDQVAESTLRVMIQEQGAPAVVSQTDVDNPDLGSSFDLGVQGFLRIVGAVIIGLGYLIPITAIAAGVWMAVWFVRRRRATA